LTLISKGYILKVIKDRDFL